MTEKEDIDRRHDLISLYCYSQQDVYDTIGELINCYTDIHNSLDTFPDYALKDIIHGLRIANMKLKRIKQNYIPCKIRDRN